MGERKVLTPGGKVIDLDRNNSIDNLPPESLVLDQKTYGLDDPSSFLNLVTNTNIRTGYGQFYDFPQGMQRLLVELNQMKLHSPFPYTVHQDTLTGDIYYIVFLHSNGVIYRVKLTYSVVHPNLSMDALVLEPKLDMSRMSGHWLGDNRPCYILNWSRDWKALTVLTQLSFWFDDYSKGSREKRRWFW